ncbi:2-hydroxyacid dehydrogenase [Chenggangzhangella methanolivorans]
MASSPVLLLTSLSADDEAAWLHALRSAMPDEVVETDPDRPAVEIAIVANPPPGGLRGLPALKWVHSLWAGVDGLLKDPTVPDVPVLRLVDPTMAQAMAETVAAAVLGLHREFDVYGAQQRAGLWSARPFRFARDRAVTILGLGEMGRASAALLKAVGFDVRGWSRSGATIEGVRTFAGADGFLQAVRGAEILVNLLPLTPETEGVLCAKTFEALAGGACVVNFGRGGHVAESDLVDALNSGRLRHAVLDVFRTEPPPAGHPFWSHPGVTILPHVAAPTDMSSASAVVAVAVATYRMTGVAPEGLDRRRGY